MAEEIKKAKLKDLVLDDRNFNKGTERGRELIEKSLREFGAGRSVLIDKNNRIIAGNKTRENAEAVGLDDVIIVETDGTKLVAVKRMDIDLDSAKGREMALADNATVKMDLSWDDDQLRELQEEQGLNLDEWGVDLGVALEEPDESELTEEKEEKPFSLKLTFCSQEDMNEFRAKYEKTITGEFDVLISVSGGLL